MAAVLVVVTRAVEVEPLMRWGWRFARAIGDDFEVLYPVRAARDPKLVTIDLEAEQGAAEDRVVKRMRAVLAELLADGEGEKEAPEVTLSRAEGRRLDLLVKDRVREIDPEYLIVSKDARGASGHDEGGLGERLMQSVYCHTVLIRAGQGTGRRCDEILIPAAGGPNAHLALKLVEKVALSEEANVTALYVQPEHGEEARSVGLRKIERTLREARVDKDVKVRPRVVVGDNVMGCIRDVAHEGFDLVLVGASGHGFVRRNLFGTIPAKLLKGDEGMAIAVIRRERPAVERWQQAARHLIKRRIPQLSRDDRVALFEHLETGSRFSFDFFALICLSTAIAALGLIQDAGAVVIGAMLVAPLLTPMIGAGLGLVQGNVVLVRRSARSVGFGFLLALLIGLFIGIVTPIPQLTHELQARGAPNLLDLAIAFVSGAAAAYAVARPNLSGALPGVAIAAALVPPIATTGVALAMGELATAQGSAMLFGTNLVAIILAASLTLFLLGVRGDRARGQRRLWVRRTIMGLTLAVLVLSFPLTSAVLSRIAEQATGARPVESELRALVVGRLEDGAGEIELSAMEWVVDQDGVTMRVVVESPEPAPSGLADDLADLVATELGRAVNIELVTLLATEARSVP